MIDRYLAKAGYSGQLTDEPADPAAPGNLFDPVPGATARMGASTPGRGRRSWEMFTSRHRDAFWATVFLGTAAGAYLLAKRLRIEERSVPRGKDGPALEAPPRVDHPGLARAHPAVISREPERHARHVRRIHLLLQALRRH